MSTAQQGISTEEFFQFEEDHQLFEQQINGRYYWDVLRAEVYGLLNWSDLYKSSGKIVLKKNLGHLTRVLFGVFRFFWHLLFSNYQQLFITSSRFHNSAGKKFDKNLIEAIEYMQKPSMIVELQNGFKRKDYALPQSFRAVPSITGLIRFLMNRFGKPQDFSYLLTHLDEAFPNHKINQDFLNKVWIKYKADYLVFRFIFRQQKGIRAVFLGQYGGIKGIIKAAREKGITTVEIQHGRLSKDSVGMAYPTIQNEASVLGADYFLSFANFWSTLIDNPRPKEFWPVGNSHYLSNANNQSSSITKGLSIISTWMSDDEQKIALELVQNGFSDQIYFKLHPDEFKDKHKYIQLFEAYPTISVISDELSISDLIEYSNAALLIHSTVAYEFLNAGVKCIIAKRHGYEIMKDLFGFNGIIIAESIKEIVNAYMIDIIPQKDQFFKAFDKALFKQFLGQIGL